MGRLLAQLSSEEEWLGIARSRVGLVSWKREASYRRFLALDSNADDHPATNEFVVMTLTRRLEIRLWHRGCDVLAA